MNFNKFQFAGKPQAPVLAEKGEVFKTPDGDIQQIASHAPSHDDGEQVSDFGIKSTSKGNGGVVVDADSVLSDSYSQVSTGNRKNSMKEQIVKIKAEEGEIIASQLGLDIRLKKSVSPSKLFLEIQEAKDKIALKIMKASEKTQKTRESSNALQANQAQLASLPTDEEIYEAIFHTQEEKKENSFLDFDEESTSQFGGDKKNIQEGKDFLTNWYSKRKTVTKPIDVSKSLDYVKDDLPHFVKATGLYNPISNKAHFDENKEVTASLATHEFTHAIDDKFGDSINIKGTPYENNTRILKTDYTNLGVKPIDGSLNTYGDLTYNYVTKPEETYARLNELRQSSGYEPNKIVTAEDIKKLKRNNDLFMFYSDEDIMRMWNELSSNSRKYSTLENPTVQSTAKFGIKKQFGGAHYNKNLNYILPNSLLDEKNEDVEEPVFKLKKKEIKGDKRNGYSAYEQNGEIYMDNINDEPIKQHETFHYLRSKGYFSPREQAIENELLDGSIYSPLDKNKLNSDIYSPEELAARFHSISGYLPNNYKEEDFKKLWETGKDLQIQDLKQVIPYDKALYYMNNYHPSKMQMGGMVSKDSSNLKEIKKQRD